MTVEATLQEIEPWQEIVEKYSATGKPGFTHFIDPDGCSWLLYYDDRKKLRGVLKYEMPALFQYATVGQFSFWVHPNARRKGIGTMLLEEADIRWGLHFDRQEGYTPAGAECVNAYLKRRG